MGEENSRLSGWARTHKQPVAGPELEPQSRAHSPTPQRPLSLHKLPPLTWCLWFSQMVDTLFCFLPEGWFAFQKSQIKQFITASSDKENWILTRHCRKQLDRTVLLLFPISGSQMLAFSCPPTGYLWLGLNSQAQLPKKGLGATGRSARKEKYFSNPVLACPKELQSSELSFGCSKYIGYCWVSEVKENYLGKRKKQPKVPDWLVLTSATFQMKT